MDRQGPVRRVPKRALQRCLGILATIVWIMSVAFGIVAAAVDYCACINAIHQQRPYFLHLIYERAAEYQTSHVYVLHL